MSSRENSFVKIFKNNQLESYLKRTAFLFYRAGTIPEVSFCLISASVKPEATDREENKPPS
jgi:hypothetical protein